MSAERKDQERELADRLARKALQVCRAAGANFRDPSVFAAIGAAVKDVVQEEFPGLANFAKRARLLPRVKEAIGRASKKGGKDRRKNWREFQERKDGGPLFKDQ
jgi:hypothetical protein